MPRRTAAALVAEPEPRPRLQIQVLEGSACQCRVPAVRTRDDDAFLCSCPECGATWLIGLA